MTKIFKITAIAASAAVATISCHKQEIECSALDPVMLKFISEREMPESKTAWDGASVSWSEVWVSSGWALRLLFCVVRAV